MMVNTPKIRLQRQNLISRGHCISMEKSHSRHHDLVVCLIVSSVVVLSLLDC